MPKLDDYVTLGRSGLRVSPLCLGTMTFGEDWAWGSDVETSKRVIDAYLDAGGNFLDTANIYTNGHSEAIIGEHLAGDARKRDRAVIATKFMGNMHRGDPNGGGAGAKALHNAVEQSLRRLRTDAIDLLWAHFWDRHTPIDEMLRSMERLVQHGKVRHLGLSDHPAWVCATAQLECRIRGWSPIVGLQIEYSLAERTVEGELIPMALEHGMGVTPWSPLKGGHLTGKYTRDKHPDEGRGAAYEHTIPESRWEIIDELLKVSEEADCTPAEAALAWVRERPGVSSTIIGARTLEQLEKNLRSLDVELSAEHRSRLDEVSTPSLDFPHDFLERAPTAIQNGASVNGVRSEPWHMMPDDPKKIW